MDLGNQIRWAVAFFYFAALCWWQVAVEVRSTEARIPPNKVHTGSLELGISDQAQLYVVLPLLAAVLPWWESKAAKKMNTGSFLNKVRFLVFLWLQFSLSAPSDSWKELGV